MTKLAYIVSRFPKTTETFIINEVKAFRDNGIDLDVYTLLRQKQYVHKGLSDLESCIQRPGILLEAVSGLFYWVTRKPLVVIKLLALIVSELKQSPKILVKTLFLFPRFLYIAKCCQLTQVSHVHCGFANYAATAGLVIFQLTNIHFSITGHANDLFRTSGLLKQKIKHCSKCYVISDYNKRYLHGIVHSEYTSKIEVLRAGADTHVFDFNTRTCNPETASLLCVASLLEKKGHKYLLDAIAILVSRGFNGHCNLVGEGPLKQSLELQIKSLNLQRYVTLHGARSHDSVREIFSNTSLFVLPCVEARDGVMDGIPVAIMESMAMGVPVVTTAVSGIPELVIHNETGLLANQQDATDLALQIQRLLDDDKLFQKIACAANGVVRKDYDMKINYGAKAQAMVKHLSMS